MLDKTADPRWQDLGDGDNGGPLPLNLSRIFEFLRRYRSTILLPIVLAVAAMLIYVSVTKPVFTADSHLLIDANLPQVFRDPLGDYRASLDGSQVESQIAILLSEQIALIAITKLNLQADPEFASRSSFPPVEEGSKSADAHMRRVIEAFQRGLRIQRLGRSYVIEVSYKSENPEWATRFANATVEAYIDDQLRARADAARQGSQWLEGRIDDLRQQMNAAALKVQEFKARRDYRILGEAGAELDRKDRARTAQQNTLEELEATAQTYRKIYENYLQAHTESVQRQSYPVANARIITRATPYKSHPKVALLLALALTLGAVLGFATALLRQMFFAPALPPR